jgi:hypothetical protein
MTMNNTKLGESAFLRVSELQLNGCMVTWQEVQDVTQYMPKLRLLELGYNRLTRLVSMDHSSHCEPVIQVLNLDSNECSDWSAICRSMKDYPSYVCLLLGV